MRRSFGADLKPPSPLRSVWLGSACLVLASWVLVVPPLASQTPPAPVPSLTPSVSDPAASPEAPAAATTEQVLALSLEDAVRLALQNNLDIERERLGPQIAHTDIERARARFDPKVGLDASISQTRTLPINQTIQFDPITGSPTGTRIITPFSKQGEVTPRFTQEVITGGQYEIRFVNTRENTAPSQFGSSSRIVDPRYESSLQLTFTHPILRNFGIEVNKAPIHQAQKSEEIAQQQLLQIILNTAFSVQEAYWALVFRIQDLGTQRASQKLAEDFLAENTVRVELGTLAPIELVQAETRVKERERDVIIAEAAVREADDRLKEVLNVPETMGSWRLRLRPTDTAPFVPISSVVVEEKVALALRHRPDFIQSQLQVENREIDRLVAQNQRLPKLDIVGQASISGFNGDIGGGVANLPDAEGYNWLIGLQFEYPLGNRLARSEVERRNLELRQARVDQRLVERTIVREIRQVARDIDTAIKRVEVARATTVLAQTQLEAEQEKFRLGLSTSFNVLEFQEALTRARSQEIQALSDYNIELARLDLRTGIMQYGEAKTDK